MYKSEIVVYEFETPVLGSVGKGVLVAVECYQAAFGREPSENGAGVAASSEGGVSIDAVRVENQGVHALMK